MSELNCDISIGMNIAQALEIFLILENIAVCSIALYIGYKPISFVRDWKSKFA